MEQLRYPIGHFAASGQLTPKQREQCIEGISSMADLLRESVGNLTPEQLDTPYREEGWTVRQVIHHLADNNMNAYLRFKRGLTEEEPIIPSYREELWAELSDYSEEPVETSLMLLESLQRRFVSLLRSLGEEDYMRIFVSMGLGTLSLDTALERYVWHNRHHMAHIASLISRKGW
ncbi:putative metal-dependent hydrolase [Paenibacillus sp. 19GGS1-52]|nr:putative metal-dependent hydrolase [Paenibacillus sp. 19GGS1-52]